MKKTKFGMFYSIVLVVLFSNSVWSQKVDSSNESKVNRFEAGGQFTILRRVDADTVRETFRRYFNTTGTPEKPEIISELGLGGRFTYNFNRNIAIEAEANFFPDDKKSIAVVGMPIKVSEPGGRKFQTFFGPKIGIRKRSFGIFGKVRPGFIRLDRYEVVRQVGSNTQFFVLSSPKNDVYFFNVDVGGVFEYYPARRTVFRVDVGDAIIRYDPQKPKAINPSFTRHNLQTSIGFGFRF